jgi:hypothetical protein
MSIRVAFTQLLLSTRSFAAASDTGYAQSAADWHFSFGGMRKLRAEHSTAGSSTGTRLASALRSTNPYSRLCTSADAKNMEL